MSMYWLHTNLVAGEGSVSLDDVFEKFSNDFPQSAITKNVFAKAISTTFPFTFSWSRRFQNQSRTRVIDGLQWRNPQALPEDRLTGVASILHALHYTSEKASPYKYTYTDSDGHDRQLTIGVDCQIEVCIRGKPVLPTSYGIPMVYEPTVQHVMALGLTLINVVVCEGFPARLGSACSVSKQCRGIIPFNCKVKMCDSCSKTKRNKVRAQKRKGENMDDECEPGKHTIPEVTPSSKKKCVSEAAAGTPHVEINSIHPTTKQASVNTTKSETCSKQAIKPTDKKQQAPENHNCH